MAPTPKAATESQTSITTEPAPVSTARRHGSSQRTSNRKSRLRSSGGPGILFRSPPPAPGRGRPCVPEIEIEGPMNLNGLLHALLDEPGDPALRSAVADARTAAGIGLDLTAPPALRPLVVAAVADHTVGAARPVLAVTATSREAEDLAEALRCSCRRRRWPSSRVGDPAARAACRRAATPSAGASPCCAGWSTPRPQRRGRGPAARHRRAGPRVLQPQVAGLGDLKPVRCAPATSSPSTILSTGWRRPPTPRRPGRAAW